MTDYQKESQKDAEKAEKPRPEVHKIVTNEVTVPKKTLGQKFADTFFDGAFFKGLVHHAYRDIIVPNAKHIMFDTGKELLLGTIYRNGNVRQVLDPKNIVSRFSYQTPVNRPPMMGGYPQMGYPQQPMTQLGPAQPIEVGPRMGTKKEGLMFKCGTRKEAEDVLEAMTDIIDSDYKIVSVAEVREMLGLEHTPVDNNWGWFSILGARVTAMPDGFLLELPQPEAL